jgi:hypothetical protein
MTCPRSAVLAAVLLAASVTVGQEAKPPAAKDQASSEVAVLKLDNLRLRVLNKVKDVAVLQGQLQTIQAQAAKIQGDLKVANDEALRLIDEWYTANGRSRAEWDINLATMEFTRRPTTDVEKP